MIFADLEELCQINNLSFLDLPFCKPILSFGNHFASQCLSTNQCHFSDIAFGQLA